MFFIFIIWIMQCISQFAVFILKCHPMASVFRKEWLSAYEPQRLWKCFQSGGSDREDRKERKGWELWDPTQEVTLYTETHGVDVKDAQGVVRCQYQETLNLYIHATYANKGNKFNSELTYLDTTCEYVQ